ncbi:MAG TPA: DUF58 domain-containing protein [Candidatus Krumholzibacteria bacterium]|nr:DUF58 domain-containing protein [Candidatus Krumholzibacteria bacterium]
MERNSPDTKARGSGIPADLLDQVRRLEIRTRRTVEELFGGEYHSVFKGRGVEFREVREYEPGDDVRSIDWNVTARQGSPFVKQFEEERELTILLLADLSASEAFGSGRRSKGAVLAEMGALLAFSAVSNGDKVGLILFSDKVELYVPPAKGRRHALRLLRELLYFEPSAKGTDLRVALQTLNRVQKRKAVCFLMSDFLARDYEKDLLVSARRHDLTAIHLVDPREREIPAVGLIQVEDAETGELLLVDSSDANLRSKFAERARDRQQEVKRGLRRAGCDLIEIDVTQPVIDPLLRFFARRGKRR